jgi:hypothetical protein
VRTLTDKYVWGISLINSSLGGALARKQNTVWVKLQLLEKIVYTSRFGVFV